MGRASDNLTVVLVSFNSAHILADALAPLAPLKHVMVVDNGSGDGSAALARRILPHAVVIENGANLGYGRANNVALERVATPFALLLNPDCIVDPDTLETLLDAAHRYPEAALLAPKIFDAPGKLGDSFGRAFPARGGQPLIEPAGDLCCEFLTGAALLLRMDAMRGVGFFDPWFFLYFEDDDLCLRARRAGHALVVVAEASVLHRVKQSSAPSLALAFRRYYCMTLSKLYVERKYFGAPRCAASWLRVLVGSLLTLPLVLLTFNRRQIARVGGRLAAALMAPSRLRQPHCVAVGPRRT